MTANDVKSILYFERYVVIEPGDSGLESKQLITQDEFVRLAEQYGDKFYASIGADAVKELLNMVNIEDEIVSSGASSKKRKKSVISES